MTPGATGETMSKVIGYVVIEEFPDGYFHSCDRVIYRGLDNAKESAVWWKTHTSTGHRVSIAEVRELEEDGRA